MDLIFIFAIAVGLAMDAFAVSVSAGVYERSEKLLTSLKLAIVFGGFQGGMCLAGWFAGREFSALISDYDHWVAFILLLVIGLKMFYEGVYGEEGKKFDLTAPSILIFLGVATSIDALAAGLSFAFFDMNILFPAFVIGAVTFGMSFAGVHLGGRFGEMIGKRAEIIGGCILIILGIKILIEGLV